MSFLSPRFLSSTMELNLVERGNEIARGERGKGMKRKTTTMNKSATRKLRRTLRE